MVIPRLISGSRHLNRITHILATCETTLISSSFESLSMLNPGIMTPAIPRGRGPGPSVRSVDVYNRFGINWAPGRLRDRCCRSVRK